MQRPLAVVASALLILPVGAPIFSSYANAQTNRESDTRGVHHRFAKVQGLDIFYREAGSTKNPTVLLLHGFPTSSYMFRNLIPALADKYHVIAPDYPGFGNSSAPGVTEFNYTFDNLASVVESLLDQKGVKKFSMYVQDYGAPVGYRLFAKSPERIHSIIVQNGNAYEEGLREFWKPLKSYWADKSEANASALRGFLKVEATKWQWTHGVRTESVVSPDTWQHDQALLDRPGNQEIQLALFYDYGTNPARYPAWHALFRKHQPPTLIVWGKNDFIFPAEGAHPYRRDLKNVTFHLLDTGHFALEEEGDTIAKHIRTFLAKSIR